MRVRTQESDAEHRFPSLNEFNNKNRCIVHGITQAWTGHCAIVPWNNSQPLFCGAVAQWLVQAWYSTKANCQPSVFIQGVAVGAGIAWQKQHNFLSKEKLNSHSF